MAVATRGLAFTAIHLPTVDPALSERFYTDVLCGLPRAAGRRFHFGDFDIVLGDGRGRGTGHKDEYPHYAFTVTPSQFVNIKRRLDAFGVPTNEPWSRTGKAYALMYFRDPAGNQFELFAPEGCAELSLRVGANFGGDYRTDFGALSYTSMREPQGELPPPSRPSGYNHMTMPVRDLEEARRFFVDVVGAEVCHDVPGHVTTILGGVQIGFATQASGWPDADAAFPYYEFRADVETVRTLEERLRAARAQYDCTEEDGNLALGWRDPSGNIMRAHTTTSADH